MMHTPTPIFPQPQGHTGASVPTLPVMSVKEYSVQKSQCTTAGWGGCISDERGHLSTPSEGDAGWLSQVPGTASKH